MLVSVCKVLKDRSDPATKFLGPISSGLSLPACQTRGLAVTTKPASSPAAGGGLRPFWESRGSPFFHPLPLGSCWGRPSELPVDPLFPSA